MVPPLKKMGEEIRAAKYETKYSSYVYDKPEEVKAKEDEVDRMWAELDVLAAAKREVLDDDLGMHVHPNAP